MPLNVFIEMTISAAVTVWSPGPNNILLLSTSSKYGVKKNAKLLLGIWSGSLSLMCLCGIFCSTLGSIVPGIQPVMKYVGASYILYLAWQTWKRTPPKENEAEKEPSYVMGLFLQLLNVKIIVYGLTMFSSFIPLPGMMTILWEAWFTSFLSKSTPSSARAFPPEVRILSKPSEIILSKLSNG